MNEYINEEGLVRIDNLVEIITKREEKYKKGYRIKIKMGKLYWWKN